MCRNISNTPLQVWFIVGAVATAQTAPTLAQDDTGSAWRYKIGIGVSGQKSPFQSDEEKGDAEAFPWFSIENHWLSIDPTGLAISMVRHDQLQVDALLAPRWLDADPADNE